MTKTGKPAGLGHNRPPKQPPKLPKERQKDYEKRLRKAGFKRLWIDPVTQEIMADLGGKEELAADHAKLERLTQEQSEKIEKLEQSEKNYVKLITTFHDVRGEEIKATKQEIKELEERGQKLDEKNAELEQTAEKQADLIDNQTSELAKLRDDLEKEQSRTLIDRVISALLRK